MKKPFIIAEVSANHNGSFHKAKALVKAAADAGASAVKFQTYTPKSMVADPDYVLEEGPWAGQRLIDLYEKAHTPKVWHKELFDYARELKIIPFSSPFDLEAVDFLESLDCQLYKIASFEILDLELIEKCANTGKPVIISTGMASEEEIRQALQVAGNNAVLLKCTSDYPATARYANLATMHDMKKRFNVPVGISDHTLGVGVSVAAVALGASVVEKHLTLSRKDFGPDSTFSMEPREFAEMVKACEQAYMAIGKVKYGPSEAEAASIGLRRSLYFTENLYSGEIVKKHHLKTARPALGIKPVYAKDIVGRTLQKDVTVHEPVTWEAFL